MKKKNLIKINVILLLLLVLVFFLRFYRQKVVVACEYDKEYERLGLFENIDGAEKKGSLRLIAFFNEVPDLSQIEVLNKLTEKISEVRVSAIFCRKFKSTIPILFSHEYKGFKSIECKYQGSYFKNNYYVVLKDDCVKYMDQWFDVYSMGQILDRYGEERYLNRVVNKDILKNRIHQLFHSDSLIVTSISQGRDVIVNEDMGLVNHVHVYHSGCSPCHLRDLAARFSRIPPGESVDIYVFPFFSIRSELESVLGGMSVHVPVFIDEKDVLGIGFSRIAISSNPLVVKTDVINKEAVDGQRVF